MVAPDGEDQHEKLGCGTVLKRSCRREMGQVEAAGEHEAKGARVPIRLGSAQTLLVGYLDKTPVKEVSRSTMGLRGGLHRKTR